MTKYFTTTSEIVLTVEFGWINWSILVIFLVVTTLFGHILKGRNKGLHGFFLGNRKIPWPAVSGSLIATQTSALTFIAVPAFVYKPGGNLTYLQILIAVAINLCLTAVIFIKPYYKKEIYSPYDFMSERIDKRIGGLARLLFTVGAVLSQGIRFFATALVLSEISGLSILNCILIIAVFSIIWTNLGGITSVIWTDVIQFCVFMAGAIFVLIWTLKGLPVSISESLEILDEKGKLTIINLSTDPSKALTIWTAFFALPVFGLALQSVDQVTAQRILCCSNYKDAQKAVLASFIGQAASMIMLLVGLAIFVHYQFDPLSEDASLKISQNYDRIFPHYLVNEMPVGVSGFIIAAIFAAGISTLDSALAALSQTVVMGPYKSFMKKNADDKHYVLISKIAVVFWAFVLSIIAWIFSLSSETSLLVQGLEVPAYVYGTLLGIALLAVMKKGDFISVLIGTVASILTVFAIRYFPAFGNLLNMEFPQIHLFWAYPVSTIVFLVVSLIVRYIKRIQA